VNVGIDGVTDPDGDGVSITVTGIKQDEAVDAPGSGSTCPDAAGVGTSTASVRAERTGQGDGRLYHIAFRADDGRGESCTGTVSVCVPHDANGSCVDGGSLFDSLTPANCTSVTTSPDVPSSTTPVIPVAVSVPADTPGEGKVKVKAQAFIDPTASALSRGVAVAATVIKVSTDVTRALRPGQSVTLTLRLNRRGKQLLRRLNTLSVRINVQVARKGIEKTAFDLVTKLRR
jgi:hypothetical protein